MQNKGLLMSIYSDNIEHLHFEPTSACNARCPQCPRNYFQSLHTNPFLSIDHWKKEDLEKTLNDTLFKNLKKVLVNGNFGDLVMHPAPQQILEPFLERNLKIQINTNGGALSTDFWQWLGSLPYDVTVTFGIDGLEDTHHLYRRNTSFKTVIKNAKTFISAGGIAVWMMTKFDHNKHQMKACKDLSRKHGFFDFQVRPSYGKNGILSVKDKNFDHEYYLDGSSNKKVIYFSKDKYKKGLDNYFENWSSRELKYENDEEINCWVKAENSVFLSYDKRLWPCCHTALSYNLEDSGQTTHDVKNFYRDYETKDKDFNNVLKHKPSKIMKQVKKFARLSQSWNTDKPCITCQNTCGVKS